MSTSGASDRAALDIVHEKLSRDIVANERRLSR